MGLFLLTFVHLKSSYGHALQLFFFSHFFSCTMAVQPFEVIATFLLHSGIFSSLLVQLNQKLIIVIPFLIITLIYHIYQLMTKITSKEKKAARKENFLFTQWNELVCFCALWKVINQTSLKHSFGRFSINAWTFINVWWEEAEI